MHACMHVLCVCVCVRARACDVAGKDVKAAWLHALGHLTSACLNRSPSPSTPATLPPSPSVLLHPCSLLSPLSLSSLPVLSP